MPVVEGSTYSIRGQSRSEGSNLGDEDDNGNDEKSNTFSFISVF
jgi:hypothetical protein